MPTLYNREHTICPKCGAILNRHTEMRDRKPEMNSEFNTHSQGDPKQAFLLRVFFCPACGDI